MVINFTRLARVLGLSGARRDHKDTVAQPDVGARVRPAIPRVTPALDLACHWSRDGDSGRLDCRWQPDADAADAAAQRHADARWGWYPAARRVVLRPRRRDRLDSAA